MSDHKNAFQRHSDDQQKQYEREARLQYGAKTVNESVQRWNSYSQDKQDAIIEEGNQIYSDLATAIEAGKSPTDSDVQAILDRWQEHLRYFYEPNLDILRGLGQMYNAHPDFIANFKKIHVDLPVYLETAIVHYVDELETAEIEQMLADDEELNQRRNNLSL